VISRLISAGARAALVLLLVLTPSLILPGQGKDVADALLVVAAFLSILTFIEYATEFPSLVEFRDAPPFNRLRFLTLFMTVLLLSVVARAEFDPTLMVRVVRAVGLVVGYAMDFPYSPVRLVVLVLPESSEPGHVIMVRSMAGLAYLTSLVMLAVFVIVIRLQNWPENNGPFNLWVNLPTFDPTSGGDIVDHLNRDARLNIIAGFVLPFVLPGIARLGANQLEPGALLSPQAMVWTLTLWAFLPASLFMRGIALGRIADTIAEERKAEEARRTRLIGVRHA